MPSASAVSDVAGVEFTLAAEKAGGGGAVDADSLAPLGGGHADVFEVSGEEFMRGQGEKGFVVRGLIGSDKLGEGFEVVCLIGSERVTAHEVDDCRDGIEFDLVMQGAWHVQAAKCLVGFGQFAETGQDRFGGFHRQGWECLFKLVISMATPAQAFKPHLVGAQGHLILRELQEHHAGRTSHQPADQRTVRST